MSPTRAASFSNIRRIVTPEGIAIPFKLATIGDRALAFLIDMTLIVGVTIAIVLLALLATSAGGLIALAVAQVSMFFLFNFYFVYMELRSGGATVGKQLLGLRVISRDGGPLVAEAVIARNLTRDLELYLPLAALMQPRLITPSGPGWGLLLSSAWLFVFALLPLMNRDRMRCGDIIGGTLVVKVPAVPLLGDLAETASLPSSWEYEPARGKESFLFTPGQLDLYGIHELQVLEDVLRRSQGYKHRGLVERVCEKIKQKINWPEEQWEVDPDAFLLDFYKAQRARLEHRMLFGERRERKKE